MRPVAWIAPFLLLACTTAPGEDGDGAAGVPVTPSPGAAADATPRDLHYTADLRVMESFPVQLDARVQVHNPTSQTAAFDVPGGCPLHLLAYRDSARTDLAWDQGHAIACTLQIEMVRLEPGQQREFATRSDARAILADSLPDGRYHMSVRLTIGDTAMIREVGSVDLGVPR